ncbi:MAG: four helix bundle protein [Bacteroidaceae bacterium]|nr:four helix bundle protein [Bacteroidaceae bacterium]
MKESVIGEKSMNFAIRIVKLYTYLRDTKNEHVLSKQILRSGTSIGANTRESKNAQSKKDFMNKLNIALKEADETEYWLELLYRTDYLTKEEYTSINNDNREIIKILTTIIKKLKIDTCSE